MADNKDFLNEKQIRRLDRIMEELRRTDLSIAEQDAVRAALRPAMAAAAREQWFFDAVQTRYGFVAAEYLAGRPRLGDL